MKLISRVIVGFVVGLIIGAFFIRKGYVGVGTLSFLTIWILIIWFLSDNNLDSMARNAKRKKKRREKEAKEADYWRRKSYHEEIGRRKAEENIKREKQEKELARKYPLGYPALSRSVFGKRSRL